jgi:hypothetical protein
VPGRPRSLWPSKRSGCAKYRRTRSKGNPRAYPVTGYSSVMRSSGPASLAILMVIVLLAAVLAAGYFIGREYVNRRVNKRNW